MATILFQAAGAALGSVFGPVGAMIGRAAGALAGSAVDQALFGSHQSTVKGPRLSSARIPGADEGAAVNRVYGTARIGGSIIWATRFEEQKTTERTGGKSTPSGPKVESFRYFANFAVGLCEGEIAGVRRVWADGRELDLSQIEMRIYNGTLTQQPDPLIEAKQGTGMTPAFRGLAYVVFERLGLESFGNRIPLLQFEVVRPVGELEQDIRAVCLIPGASEHGYHPVAVSETIGAGSARFLNRNTSRGLTDWDVSIDELMAVCPNLERVALVVSWFGTDLRAEQCRIVPGVETPVRSNESSPWQVSGISRAQAYRISQNRGGPAYGGTPNDASVIAAIADLKARGLKVYLYPFLMMDIAQNNALPDPYGSASQLAYPWRGRITCFPAIGQSGSADKTQAARNQIQAFCGSAAAKDFTVSGSSISYHGLDSGYRRFILHYAQLAKAAGGVSGFLLGSELRGLTQVRDHTGSFPFVGALSALASDVKTLLPSAKLTYGADWSEYFGYHPQDKSGDVYFHLDPLWASPAIDAIGIDNYMPLADWRDDDLVQTSPDGMRSACDRDAMIRAITAGEGFDWYYASDEARQKQRRTPITDGLKNKPWIYRYKDIEAWWSNPHYERVGGQEKSQPTSWVPKSKPVWFTELGCAAVDKGANQPNVFADPKSAESAAPYFSNRTRSDSTQRRFLEAHHRYWRGGKAPLGMVDPSHFFVWCWDARPFPAFPHNMALWSDGANWQTGHWLNGRLGTGTLADIIGAIFRDHGFEDYDVSQVSGDLTGYVQGDVANARHLLDPLLATFQIDVLEEDGLLRLRSRGKASLAPVSLSVMADIENEPLWQEKRGHDSDFAAEAIVSFYNPALDYEQASVRSHRAVSITERVLQNQLNAVMTEETAFTAAENLLRDNRMARRSVSFSLPPHNLALQPGDVVTLKNGPSGRFLVTRIEDGDVRHVEAREFAAATGGAPLSQGHGKQDSNSSSSLFAPVFQFMDLPRYDDEQTGGFARAAIFARPWRTVGLSCSQTQEGYRGRAIVDQPARMGTIGVELVRGVSGRFDLSQSLIVDLPYGELSSAPAFTVLGGANRLAVLSRNGVWEILAFQEAQEIAPNRWQLTRLLRGLSGTEDAMAAGAAMGAPVVVLDEAVTPLGIDSNQMGLTLKWMIEAAGASGKAGPIAFEGGIRAETPLAPVHLRASRDNAGNVAIRWVRRARADSDNWIAMDIPFDEPFERYRIEILDNNERVKRVADVSAPAWMYAKSDETADFGAPQSRLNIRVRQMGQKVPLGLPAVRSVVI